MWIKKPGPVSERIVLLGREESCVYLVKGVKGAEHTIIGGGMIHIVPEVLAQIRDLGIDEDAITRLLVLHTHFDHCGAVPALQKRFKNLKVYVSPRGKELLANPDVVAQINALSGGMITMNKMEKQAEEFGLVFDGIRVDGAVSGGDRVLWGGNEIEIIDAPGHSSCSIGAYVPQLKALFPSDGGGIPFKNTIIASGNSNYTQFQESLEKLKDFDVEYVCADHYGYITGEEAGKFIPRSIEMAKEQRARIEKVYRSTKDIDQSARALVASIYDENPDYFLSPEITYEVYRQMVRHIASAIEKNAS